MTKHSTLPRQRTGGQPTNILLVGGAHDGTTVDVFRNSTRGVHLETGIVNGVYRIGYYRLSMVDPTLGLHCDKDGELCSD